MRKKGHSTETQTTERVRGIEPPYSAWEADVLPLNYTRRVELMGLEPTTPCLQSKCSSRLSYSPELLI